jgi:hypothetical protein
MVTMQPVSLEDLGARRSGLYVDLLGVLAASAFLCR